MTSRRPSPRMVELLTAVAANNGGTLRHLDRHLVTTRVAVEDRGWVTVDRGTPDNRGGNVREYRYTLTGEGLDALRRAGVDVTPTPADSAGSNGPESGRTLGEMTATERRSAAQRAATRLQDELDRTTPALSAALEASDGPETPAVPVHANRAGRAAVPVCDPDATGPVATGYAEHTCPECLVGLKVAVNTTEHGFLYPGDREYAQAASQLPHIVVTSTLNTDDNAEMDSVEIRSTCVDAYDLAMQRTADGAKHARVFTDFAGLGSPERGAVPLAEFRGGDLYQPPVLLDSTDHTRLVFADFSVWGEDRTPGHEQPLQQWASSTDLHGKGGAVDIARRWSGENVTVSVYAGTPAWRPTQPRGELLAVFVDGRQTLCRPAYTKGQHVDFRIGTGEVLSGDINFVWSGEHVSPDASMPLYRIAVDRRCRRPHYAISREVSERDILGVSVVIGDATAEVRQARADEPTCTHCAQWVPVTTALTVRPHRRDDSLTHEWCEGGGQPPTFGRRAPQPPPYSPRCAGCGQLWYLIATSYAEHTCPGGPTDPVDQAMVAYWSLTERSGPPLDDGLAAAIVRGTLGAPCGICSRSGRVGVDGRMVPHTGMAGWCAGAGQPPAGSCAAGAYRVAYLTLRPAHLATADWADRFRAAGFTAVEAAGWAGSGFEPSEARDWHDAGFGPHEAPAFADLQLSPAEAAERVEATLADV